MLPIVKQIMKIMTVLITRHLYIMALQNQNSMEKERANTFKIFDNQFLRSPWFVGSQWRCMSMNSISPWVGKSRKVCTFLWFCHYIFLWLSFWPLVIRYNCITQFPLFLNLFVVFALLFMQNTLVCIWERHSSLSGQPLAVSWMETKALWSVFLPLSSFLCTKWTKMAALSCNFSGREVSLSNLNYVPC